jgi:hypothetical protein
MDFWTKFMLLSGNCYASMHNLFGFRIPLVKARCIDCHALRQDGASVLFKQLDMFSKPTLFGQVSRVLEARDNNVTGE